MAHQKPNLPQKTCPACNRPFTWRKKWASTWNDVRFCSDACRTGKRNAAIAKQSKNGG